MCTRVYTHTQVYSHSQPYNWIHPRIDSMQYFSNFYRILDLVHCLVWFESLVLSTRQILQVVNLWNRYMYTSKPTSVILSARWTKFANCVFIGYNRSVALGNLVPILGYQQYPNRINLPPQLFNHKKSKRSAPGSERITVNVRISSAAKITFVE